MRRMLMNGMEENDVKEWKLIGIAESDGEGDTNGMSVEVDFAKYSEVFAAATMAESSANRRISISDTKSWYNGTPCSMLIGNVNILATLGVKIDIIDNVIYPFGWYSTGYGNTLNDVANKCFAPVYSPRNDFSVDNFKYIRYDTNNNGAIPAGETLKVYAR